MMQKILVYRNRYSNKIICIDKCPDYTKQKLDEIIAEYNSSGDETVEVKSLRDDSLELYLLQSYFASKITRKDELQSCINAVYTGAYRLRNLCNSLIEEFAPKENNKCNLPRNN